MILASLSTNTLKQYDKPIRLWWEYCLQNSISPFEASVKDIISFLTREFERDKSYGTINSYRSAISLIVLEEISENPEIRRFCKGVSNLRPQKPKYDYTWDPAIILDFLVSLGPNENLTLKQLSKKLVTLLALATAQRVQTLSKIDIENIKISDNLVQIVIPQKLKTSRVNINQPVLKLPFLTEKPLLCVATTLNSYLTTTQKIVQQT